jgi:hypothetical protein
VSAGLEPWDLSKEGLSKEDVIHCLWVIRVMPEPCAFFKRGSFSQLVCFKLHPPKYIRRLTCLTSLGRLVYMFLKQRMGELGIM